MQREWMSTGNFEGDSHLSSIAAGRASECRDLADIEYSDISEFYHTERDEE